MERSVCNIIIIIVIFSIPSVSCQFYECDNDPMPDPDEGEVGDLQFTWIGLLQYIHVKNATPHYFRVPRVVLISRQFALSTAVDAAQVPEHYALGNVVFADYERDENECGVSIEELAHGVECDPAVLLMPIADVLLHPEYKHFKTTDSIAILKLIMPIKSFYMVPACLPFKNYIFERKNRKSRQYKLMHIDFTSDVPRDFMKEDKEITRLHLLPRELCYLYDDPVNGTFHMKNRIACTTGCNFHSGAPTLVHEHTGHWSVVAISEGGSPCPDPLRARRPPAPPRHILLHPYVPWITAAITGKAVGGFAKDDPFGYIMPRYNGDIHMQDHDWIGHWYLGGDRCFDRGELADDLFKFYHEIFQVKPTTQTYLSYHLEIFSSHDSTILCVKVGLPWRLGKPNVKDLNTPVVNLRIPTIAFKTTYRFIVEAWGINNTESSDDFDSESKCASDSRDSQGECKESIYHADYHYS